MPRSSFLFLVLLQLLSATQVSAQRATMTVSAQVLPAREALAAGTFEVREETGHTMAAAVSIGHVSARLLPKPKIRTSKLPGVKSDALEVNVGLRVGSNVHYQAEIRSDSGSRPVVIEQPRMRSGTSDTTQNLKVVLPDQQPNGASNLTVVLTAISIS